MSWIDKGSLLLRRMSALYLFFIVLVVFFVLFYYKYVPSNREELNERGQRALAQLIANFTQKDKELRGIFGGQFIGKEYDDLVAKSNAFEYLDENVHYDIDTVRVDTLSHLQVNDNGDGYILYRNNDNIEHFNVTVKVKDFADPIFSARDDIFDTYFLLLDSSDRSGRKSNAMRIIYRKTPISSSSFINVDTLGPQERNSDLSGICTLHIGGLDYQVFFAPFDYYGQRIVLAGLVQKATFDQQVQSTPVNFIPLSFIIISLILIGLSVTKLFLLSPKESINSRDVLATAVSFYVGSSVICVIIFYSFLSFVTDLSLNNRLTHFSGKIRADIESEIQLADLQLKQYDNPSRNVSAIYDSLARRDHDTDRSAVDSICAPGTYKNISRLIWADSDGNTMAKWNPFDYEAPFTNVKNYPSFTLLQSQQANVGGVAGVDIPVVYPGKSNLTAEFQTNIVRRSGHDFPVIASGRDRSASPGVGSNARSKAYCIAIAAILHCSIHPVIPRGFGFCLIDNDGKVLIDADARRNLSENIITESGNDATLMDIINHKTSDRTFDLHLYGKPCIGRCDPIVNQPLYLICYYDRKILSRNIFRFLHFSLETLLCLWIALAACLALSTFKEWRPMQLNFNLNKNEWIRPSAMNDNSRAFTFVYFLLLAVLSLAFFAGISVFGPDLNGLFYLALLLPFYTVLGTLLSRGVREDGQPANAKDVQLMRSWFMRSLLMRPKFMRKLLLWSRAFVRVGLYPVLAIIIINIIVWQMIRHTRLTGSGYYLAGFQLVQVLLLAACCACNPLQWKWKKLGERIGRIRNKYTWSLYLSILLIGVLPTLGILTYGFYAEKIQYKKDKLLFSANNFFQRSNYLLTDLLPKYRPIVLKQLGGRQECKDSYRDSLIYVNSIYLMDRDLIRRTDIIPGSGTAPEAGSLPDGLYTLLMDKIYHADQVWGDGVSIQDKAGDNSWEFRTVRESGETKVRLLPKQPVEECRYVELEANLQTPLADLLHLPGMILLLFAVMILALLALIKNIIDAVIKRLFLMDIMSEEKIKVDVNYLRELLQLNSGGELYLINFSMPKEGITPAFFIRESQFDTWVEGKPNCSQEEFILAMTDYFSRVYEYIWNDQSSEEQYILLDFAIDRYTNYKNSPILHKLIHKGLLHRNSKEGALDMFSLSFRQYVLSKRNKKEGLKLKEQFSTGGAWESIRIPILSILAVLAIFILKTETAFTSSLVAMLTTATTLVPLLFKMFAKSGDGGA